MVAFIQKAHGCIYFYNAIEAQEAQLAISDRLRAAAAAAAPLPSCRRPRAVTAAEESGGGGLVFYFMCFFRHVFFWARSEDIIQY